MRNCWLRSVSSTDVKYYEPWFMYLTCLLSTSNHWNFCIYLSPRHIIPRISNCGKKSLSTFWNVIWKSMRSFWISMSKSLWKSNKKKIEILYILRTWWLISIFGCWPKIRKVHIRSVPLTSICSVRPLLKCLMVRKILVKKII